MRTLILMRHAKSSWSAPDLDDHERSLNSRGTRDAPRMARYLQRENLLPDAVLCSDAVRTRATLALLLAEWGASASPFAAPKVIFDPVLYLAEPAALLEVIGRSPASAQRLVLIGHNPGVHALALGLTGGGDRKAIADLATQFPTAGVAVIDLEATAWKGIAAGSGRLRAFVYPKSL